MSKPMTHKEWVEKCQFITSEYFRECHDPPYRLIRPLVYWADEEIRRLRAEVEERKANFTIATGQCEKRNLELRAEVERLKRDSNKMDRHLTERTNHYHKEIAGWQEYEKKTDAKLAAHEEAMRKHLEMCAAEDWEAAHDHLDVLRTRLEKK